MIFGEFLQSGALRLVSSLAFPGGFRQGCLKRKEGIEKIAKRWKVKILYGMVCLTDHHMKHTETKKKLIQAEEE